MKQQLREAWYPLQSIWRTHNMEEDEDFCKAAWPMRVPRVHQPVKTGAVEAEYQAETLIRITYRAAMFERVTLPPTLLTSKTLHQLWKKTAFHVGIALSPLQPMWQQRVWLVHLRFVFFSAILVFFHMGFAGMAGIINHRFRKPYHWPHKRRFHLFFLNKIHKQE